MKKHIFVVYLLVLLIIPVSLVFSQEVKDYVVGPGDELQITVVGHKDLDRDTLVTPEGTISFPLIGDIKVKGKTLSEINKLIEDSLRDEYLKYPQVSTLLKSSHSKVVYVYGEVASPGTYPYVDDMTVLKAVTLAGGLTKFGSEDRVKILRNSDKPDKYQVIKVNLKKVTSGGDKSKDIKVEPQDMIVVSE